MLNMSCVVFKHESIYYISRQLQLYDQLCVYTHTYGSSIVGDMYGSVNLTWNIWNLKSLV